MDRAAARNARQDGALRAAMGPRDQARRVSHRRPRVEDGQVKLLTLARRRRWTARYPARAAAAFAKLKVKSAYLDGELYGVRPDGVTSFGRCRRRGPGRAWPTFFAFDLLELDGEDVARLPPLIERKDRLDALLHDPPGSPSATMSRATGKPTAGPPASMRFLTAITNDQRDAFVAAARRWMGIITAHLTAVPLNLPAGACTALQPALDESIRDVVIFVEVVPIDGVGGVLGSGSPCVTRSESGLPVVGTMQFGSADLPAELADSQLVPIITHEMAHVLGFGTVWASKNLLTDLGGADPRFIGAETAAIWPPFATALSFTRTSPPVEIFFGAGTAGSHFSRESVFHAELMSTRADRGAGCTDAVVEGHHRFDEGPRLRRGLFAGRPPFVGNLLAAINTGQSACPPPGDGCAGRAFRSRRSARSAPYTSSVRNPSGTCRSPAVNCIVAAPHLPSGTAGVAPHGCQHRNQVVDGTRRARLSRSSVIPEPAV